MWLGQTCNLRCYFCYFADRVSSATHPEHPFMSLEKAKDICRTLVEVYGNNSIDIQGGEPTIYPHIYDLLEYCNEIGLKPTLITNAVVLGDMDRCRRLKEANVFDLLISIHGLGEIYDRIVGMKGASRRQMAAIDNCVEAGIPFRINITLTKEALSQLGDIVKFSREKGARVVNFIAFNPFIDQSQDRKRNIQTIPLYDETVKLLIPAIDFLERNDIEVNVRYLPFCVFPEQYRKFVQDFQQIIYDLHEWEAAGEIWSGASPQRRAGEGLSEPPDFFRCVQEKRDAYLAEICRDPAAKFAGDAVSRLAPRIKRILGLGHAGLLQEAVRLGAALRKKASFFSGGRETIPGTYRKKFYLKELGEVEGFSELEYAYKEFRVLMPKMIHPYEKNRVCYECDLTAVCDGVHRDYAALIGFDGIRAVRLGRKVYDPRFYMREQMKVVEEQEYEWALSGTPDPEDSGKEDSPGRCMTSRGR